MSTSIDEFVGPGEARRATPLELGKDWASKLSALTRRPAGPRDLALSAFTLIEGGDLFQAKTARPRTEPELLDELRELKLRLVANRAAAPERDAALEGSIRVLAGNPALCRRMLLARPIDVVLVPRGKDFRAHGFPPHTNPRALGVFWTAPDAERALIGLREEHVASKPFLMIHEMAHAVHFLGLTAAERRAIDAHLLPAFPYSSWVEEVVAVYAERAFGARWGDEELRAPGPYGRARREWTERAVFALFTKELFRP